MNDVISDISLSSVSRSVSFSLLLALLLHAAYIMIMMMMMIDVGTVILTEKTHTRNRETCELENISIFEYTK